MTTFMTSVIRVTLTLGLLALLFSRMTPEASAQTEFYPLIIAGGAGLDASYQTGLLVVRFTPGTKAAGQPANYQSNLAPGAGSWVDRPLREGEPVTIHQQMTEQRANEAMTWLHHEGGFWTFYSRNAGAGYYDVARSDQTYAAPDVSTDRPGSSYSKLPASSWQICEQACIYDSQCAAWSYLIPASAGTPAQCSLKSQSSIAVPNTYATSGVKIRSDQRREFPTIDRLTSVELLDNLVMTNNNSHVMTLRRATIPLPPIAPEGLKITEDSEGWVDHLYNDGAHYCTIGYGHLIKRTPCDGTEPANYLAGMRQIPDGVTLLQGDMYSAHYAVATAVTAKLTDTQAAALIDFVFNVGSGNFRRSTLLQVVNAGQLSRVPTEFQRWVVAGGKRWPGLVARRQKEIDLYFRGIQRLETLRRRGAPTAPELPPIDIQAGEHSQ